MNRIDETFARIRSEGRLGLFPYFTAGFPTLEASERLILAALEAGGDGLELGVPFSDPLADGATMQHASEVALRNGSSLRWSLELISRLRSRTQAPIVPMTYFNPVHHYGIARFVQDAVSAGADGVIVPDLPSGEAAELEEAARAADLHVIPMVAPTTTEERLAEVGQTPSGFVYCVSLIGTTGTRQQLSDQLPSFMARVRAHAKQPLVIGFGIARPEHVVAVRPLCDAVIVASAIADMLTATPPDDWETRLRAFIHSLRGACESPLPAGRA